MTLCALLLYAVYVLALENERMHRFKRAYLVFSLVFSLTVLLITVPVSVPGEISANINDLYTAFPVFHPDNAAVPETNPVETVSPVETGKHFDYWLIVKILYVAVVTGLFIRLIYNLLKMIFSSGSKRKIPYDGAFIIPVPQKIEPYSFYKYIFVNETDYSSRKIPDEILVHELAHVRQRHFLDILFIETLIAVFWFNPVFYLYRRKIKLNHEFLADEKVLEKGNDIACYQQLLLNTLSKKRIFIFTHNFNFPTTKKRFMMMTKKISPRRALSKKMALVPLFAAAVFIFSAKTAAQNDAKVLPEQTTGSMESPNQDDKRTLPPPGKGVSREQRLEFMELVSKYFDINKEEKTVIYSLSDEERTRLYDIYAQMDEKQRNTRYFWRFESEDLAYVTSRTGLQEKMDPLFVPNKEDEIWLNGENIEHSTLASYDEKDFLFVVKKLINENPKKYRTDLWTKKGFENYLLQSK
jgi:hypothetical protein